MSTRWVAVGLLLTILFQGLVLSAEYLGAVHPLWTGQEIRLKTVPVDPRSLFRGNYARLRYEISSVPVSAIENPDRIRNDEPIFVRLKRGEDGIHDFDGAFLSAPESGLFIRGRVIRPRSSSGRQLQVRYGIEAWFAPKEKALQLERDLGRGALAVVMISASGRATLAAIEKQPVP